MWFRQSFFSAVSGNNLLYWIHLPGWVLRWSIKQFLCCPSCRIELHYKRFVDKLLLSAWLWVFRFVPPSSIWKIPSFHAYYRSWKRILNWTRLSSVSYHLKRRRYVCPKTTLWSPTDLYVQVLLWKILQKCIKICSEAAHDIYEILNWKNFEWLLKIFRIQYIDEWH